jgi:hypothetical protein
MDLDRKGQEKVQLVYQAGPDASLALALTPAEYVVELSHHLAIVGWQRLFGEKGGDQVVEKELGARLVKVEELLRKVRGDGKRD